MREKEDLLRLLRPQNNFVQQVASHYRPTRSPVRMKSDDEDQSRLTLTFDQMYLGIFSPDNRLL